MLAFVIGLATGILATFVVAEITQRFENPFRWVCPICDFRIESKEQETLEVIKSTHRHT